MKRKVFALLLVFCMMFQTVVGVNAFDTNSDEAEDPISEIRTIDNTGISETSDENGSTGNETTGVTNFELQLKLDFKISLERLEELVGMFRVCLQSADSVNNGEDDLANHPEFSAKHVHAYIDSYNEDMAVFKAENVEPGEYRLTLETEYFFQDFSQNLTIKPNTKSTLVFTDSYNAALGGMGVFALGDLNADGLINEEDSKVLIEHNGHKVPVVSQKPEEGQDVDSQNLSVPEDSTESDHSFEYVYDLNQDKIIDIADLAILVYNLDQETKPAVAIETLLPTVVKVEAKQEAAIPQGERKLDTIMEDAKEPITLAPKEDAVISEENPVKIEMDINTQEAATGGIVISAPADTGPTSGTIEVERIIGDTDLDGVEETEVISVPIVDESAPARKAKTRSIARAAAQAIRKADGSIVIDLGQQIAIKKVTIVVTATATSTKLTEIAKVEFLNDMETRIPEPELNIPQNIVVSGKGDQITITWDQEQNVTGYEVSMYAIDTDGKKVGPNIYRAGINEIEIQEFEGGRKDKVTSLWDYYVSVKSVNGDWSSPYSETVSHHQLAGGPPPAPDMVSINSKYRQLDVSWKDMQDTEYYTLEYRELGSSSEFTVVNNIMTNAYKITGLKDDTSYEVYISGWNHDDNNNERHGPRSLPAVGKTINEIPKFQKYRMINNDIQNIKMIYGSGYVNDFDANQLIDGDYSTYFFSSVGSTFGVDVTFENSHKVKEIIMSNRLEDQYRDSANWDYSGMSVTLYNGEEQVKTYSLGNVTQQSLHPTAKNTIKFILPEAVEATRVRFTLIKYGFACTEKGNSISEINFFEYDSLEDDVYGLYADDMHVTLKEDVNEAKIAELEERANTIDEINNEYHPKKDLLLSELANARILLNDKNIGGIVSANPNVTLEGTSKLGFAGGLSGLQPLGYVAKSGDTVNVYVGQKGKQIGATVPVRLVFTQYHPEASAWKSGEIALKQGLNEITIPEVSSLGYEKGGSLYIVQTNSADVRKNPVQVRVSGATKIPLLDLHRPVGDARRNEDGWQEKINAYVAELEDYVAHMEANHDKLHSDIQTLDEGYNQTNCFLNSTEISLDNVLVSLPAERILAGLKGQLNSNKAGSLEEAMDNFAGAMNQMLELFYKERGLAPYTANGTHGTPTARFNVRYHRMFAGAFMYAGGSHLGIEYGSSALTSSEGLQVDENGKPGEGNMFGWGLAHEMGHCADPGGVTIAEVTNNIWSQFEKTRDTAATSRIPYPTVYKHVTSSTIGKPGQVFAQLGMYWQLHLAYDKNYSHYDYYKTGYNNDNYVNMWQNEFFARYYIYRRDMGFAPKPGGVALTNSGSVDQNIMRTAIAAAGKDLTEFFTAWGYQMDAGTQAYAAQFPKEERKIQYLNDAAREYQLANGPAMTSTEVNAELSQGTGANAKKVTFQLSVPGESNPDAILGYEIIRNGKPAAFVEPDKTSEDGVTEYVDVIGSENNRVMDYKVVAYDKYLNTTATKVFDPIKIRHDGELPSDDWTVSTNTVSDYGVLTVYSDTNVVEGKTYTDVLTNQKVTYSKKMGIKYLDSDTGETLETVSASKLIIDGDVSTSFVGSTANNSAAWFAINLNRKQNVVGVKIKFANDIEEMPYTTRDWAFSLEYSNNGGASYTRLGAFEFNNSSNGVAHEDEDGYKIAYFKKARNNQNIYGLDITNLRLTMGGSRPTDKANKIGITDIKLLGQSGDNVDIGISHINEQGKEVWDTENTIGILDKDYILDQTTGSKIPAGSFIVTGQYTGNAAYNVVKLYNEKHVMHDDSLENKVNSIINGYQVFFAEVPETGSIMNTKDGTWIYWLEPLHGENEGKFGLPGAGENGSDFVVELPTKVYAELYRVDNATTLAGERMVSDSFTIDVPAQLPTITLTDDNNENETVAEPIVADVKARDDEE